MKIFITGGTGFIGSHLVDLLLKKNFKLYVLAEYSFENSIGWLREKKNKNLNIFFGNISDPTSYENYLKQCDIVINLAALISIPYSYRAPKSYIDTNIMGTFWLLELSKKYNIKKFIHTSTSEVFGNPIYIPMDEKHQLDAHSPYAASKTSADQLALSYYHSYNLPVIILRPFNTFGPRQSLRAVIPTIILQSIKNKIIKLGNIDAKRDFTYVEDTVNAFYKSINLNKKYFGTSINLGIGKSFSIKQIIKMVEKKLNKKIIIYIDTKRIRPEKSEIHNLVSNNSKAKKILNWNPFFSGSKNFNKAINKTFDWYSKNENLKRFDNISSYNV